MTSLTTSTSLRPTAPARPIAPPQAAGPVPRPVSRPLDPPEPICPRHRWYLPIKAALEWLAALILFVVSLPLVVVLAAMVKWQSRGPALYRQVRQGRHGRTFAIRKLRTMADNCEATTGPVWSCPGDPRVTPLGRVLRDTHLDELPQLWNVLRGEMSLIGPRPERPEIAAELEQQLPGYRQRLRLRPGITGLAQMQLPPDTDLDHVRMKLAHDLFYIRHVSPWLDLRIALSTPLYLLEALSRAMGGALIRSYAEQIQCPLADDLEDLRVSPPASPGKPYC